MTVSSLHEGKAFWQESVPEETRQEWNEMWEEVKAVQ
jgi:hypothetical protein